jgi:hypothetical protein
MLTRTRGGVPTDLSADDDRRGASWSLMASLRSAEHDQFEHDDRAAESRTIAPVPAAKLARSSRPHNYRGALAFAALMAMLIGVTWASPAGALRNVATATEWLQIHTNTSGQAIASTIFLAAAGLGIVIAWTRATALKRPVRLPSGGRITVDDVAAQLRELVLQNDAVCEAVVRVDNLHRRGVRVATQLHVASHADLNRTVEAVCAQTEWFLHAHLLVRLSSIPSVELSFDELDLRAERIHDGTAHAAGG